MSDSNSCLKIDNNEKVAKQIAHGSNVSYFIYCVLLQLTFVPCMIPCFVQLIQRVVSSMYFVTSSADGEVKQIRATFVNSHNESFVMIV